MRSTFKVLFYVKKGSEKPNGNLPLMCRITVDGEIKQFSCKMDVPPRLWDVKNNRASGKSVEAQRINLAVDKIRVEVNRRYQELMQTDGYVTAAKLKDAYLGIGIKQETLLKLFEQHNAEFEKKVGHSRAQGTFTRYRTVCNHIREFLPHTYKREDIPLKELNLTFINDFEYFLRTEKKCRTNTVWGYMIVLKHIVSIARNDGRLPFNPFAGYINSPKSVDRGYLTQTEIQIQTMQADHSRQMAEVERKHRREITDKETKHKEEISFLKTVIAKAAAWFPYFREMLRIENLCRLVGFDERQTATLVKGKPLEYAGELYSEEHGRKFTTEKAGFQVVKDPTDGTRLVLAIDRKPIAEWFKEQFEKLRQNIR